MLQLKLKELQNKQNTFDFRLYEDKKEIGVIQIRKEPSFGVGVPSNMASNIYYEIFPAYKRKGYGKKILALGLEKARDMGLKEVILTVNENNIGSVKIIEWSGGIFVEEALLPNGKKMLKYKILL